MKKKLLKNYLCGNAIISVRNFEKSINEVMWNRLLFLAILGSNKSVEK